MFAFSHVEILLNFVKAFILHWLHTLKLLLHLSFKAELPTNGLQDISFLVLKLYTREKNCCKVIGYTSLFTLHKK